MLIWGCRTPKFPIFAKFQRKKLANISRFTKFVVQFWRVPLPMLSRLTEVLETS